MHEASSLSRFSLKTENLNAPICCTMEQPPVDISQIPSHTHALRTITVAIDDALTLTVNR